MAMQMQAQQSDTALKAGEPTVEWHEMRSYLQARLQKPVQDQSQPKVRVR